jgi:hypothetical protein
MDSVRDRPTSFAANHFEVDVFDRQWRRCREYGPVRGKNLNDRVRLDEAGISPSDPHAHPHDRIVAQKERIVIAAGEEREGAQEADALLEE